MLSQLAHNRQTRFNFISQASGLKKLICNVIHLRKDHKSLIL